MALKPPKVETGILGFEHFAARIAGLGLKMALFSTLIDTLYCSAGSAKLKLVQCAQGLVQFAQGISVFLLLTTNIRYFLHPIINNK